MRRPLLHVGAIVATLALTVVVAVVAVSRSKNPTAEPSASPTASPSPTVSPTSPAGLTGLGPYIVYATGDGSVLAFDVSAGTAVGLGKITGLNVGLPSAPRQPGSGRVIAFARGDGSVWKISRGGLARVGEIPRSLAFNLEGSVVSADDRKLAVSAMAPSLAVVVVDLTTGSPNRIRIKGNHDPSVPLVPVAWSLGGTLVYQVPVCHCDGPLYGLYSFDLASETSTVVPGTSTDDFFDAAVTPDAQAVLYERYKVVACTPGAPPGCVGPPFELRLAVAGRRSPRLLAKSNDVSFRRIVISSDGRRAVIQRRDENSRTSTLQFVDAKTGKDIRTQGIDAAPAGSIPIAFLSGDVLVVTVIAGNEESIVAVREGRAVTVVRGPSAGDGEPVFLGWLR